MYDAILNLWRSYKITSAADLDKYLHNFKILFAFHSGKIENDEVTFYDTREIFENGKVLNFTGTPRTLFEQQNQKLCYEMLKAKIINTEPLSINLIKETHRILTEGTYDEKRYIEKGERAGEFKKHDYIVGINEVGSAAENVEADINDLIGEINDYKGTDILRAAAYFHARFEYIHPFADGNGRVGRTLLNYYLMINNHPPLIIYDEDKHLYYSCLTEYDENEDIEPLKFFLISQTEKTWHKTLDISSGTKHPRKKMEK
jgi:Fic family protein